MGWMSGLAKMAGGAAELAASGIGKAVAAAETHALPALKELGEKAAVKGEELYVKGKGSYEAARAKAAEEAASKVDDVAKPKGP